MKNLIDEKPTDLLSGRTLFNTTFISDVDVVDRKILDIGCGFGWFEYNTLQRGVSHITGIEHTAEALSAARCNLSDAKVDFIDASALSLPFEDNSYDTVVSWEVLEHIPKGTEPKMFAEVARVLKQNGRFYLSTPHRSFFSCVFDPAWWLIGHRHYSVDALCALAVGNGFEVEKVVLNGGWWEIIGINNLYVAKWIFRRRPFFERDIRAAQDAEYAKGNGFTNIFLKLRKV